MYSTSNVLVCRKILTNYLHIDEVGELYHLPNLLRISPCTISRELNLTGLVTRVTADLITHLVG